MEKVKNGKTRRNLKIISVVFSVALVLAVLVSLPFIFENKGFLLITFSSFLLLLLSYKIVGKK